jgi:methionyl-tRNA formyltransferase
MSEHKSVVLLSKRDEWSRHAGEIAKIIFPNVVWHEGQWGESLPAFAPPDLLLSFLSPWIVPARILEGAQTAVNFHPGSADYPGIGCYNFALYDGVKRYGAVAHFMAPQVDTGTIIEDRRFDVYATDTVESLKRRTMAVMLGLFVDVASALAGAGVSGNGKWSRKPYTRKELDELCVISPEMSAEEIARRVRATAFPGFAPYVELGGRRFSLDTTP